MTYAIGARCKDGVVIVSDRIATNSDGTSAQINKIFNPHEGIVIAISGDSSMIFNFSEEIKKHQKTIQNTLYDWKNLIEDIIARLNERYKPRLGEEPLDALVCIRNPEGKRAELFYVIPNGIAYPTQDYSSIGTGRYFGEALIQPNWIALNGEYERQYWENHEKIKFVELTMSNMLPLIAYPIYYLEMHEILTTVRKGIDVWFIPDNGKERKISKEEKEIMNDKLWKMMVATRLQFFFTENKSI